MFSHEELQALHGQSTSQALDTSLEQEQSFESSEQYSRTFLGSEDATDRLLHTVGRDLTLTWRSPDGAEGHHLLPALDFETGSIVGDKYHFVAIRFLLFSDKRQLVSWCSTASCPNFLSRELYSDVFEGRSYSSARADEHLVGVNPTCSCGGLVIQTELDTHRSEGQWQRYLQLVDKAKVCNSA